MPEEKARISNVVDLLAWACVHLGCISVISVKWYGCKYLVNHCRVLKSGFSTIGSAVRPFFCIYVWTVWPSVPFSWAHLLQLLYGVSEALSIGQQGLLARFRPLSGLESHRLTTLHTEHSRWSKIQRTSGSICL